MFMILDILVDALSIPSLLLLGGKNRLHRARMIFYCFPVEMCIAINSSFSRLFLRIAMRRIRIRAARKGVTR